MNLKAEASFTHKTGKATWIKLFFLAIVTAFCFESKAQVCSGSYGDPIISENYGEGKIPGKQLPPGITTLPYTPSNCPGEGTYTIANSLAANANCHPDTWHTVPADRTGDPNGQMMIINAADAKDTYFTQTISGLCPNTTYQFSGHLLNLAKLSASGPGVIKPDVKFSIESPGGSSELASGTTGPMDAFDTPTWIFFNIYYTAPANKTEVVIKITNNAAGGEGNDFILDDIAFRACGRLVQAGFDAPGGPLTKGICEGSSGTISLKAAVTDDTRLTYQWQVNEGDGWAAIPNSDTREFTINAPAKKGKYRYRLGVATIEQFASVNCRVYSPELTLNVTPIPVVTPIAPQQFCEGNRLSITATGGTTYVWTGPNLPPTTANPLVIDNVTMANAGTYTVTPESNEICPSAPVQVEVKILPKVVATVSGGVTICSGEHTQLNASGGLYYKWTPSTGLDHDDIANPTASPAVTTIYAVSISNGGCSDDSKVVQVNVNPNVTADAGGDKAIFEGQSVVLNGKVGGEGITGISWTPETGLDNPASATPVATPTDNTTYTLQVSSAKCGIVTSTVFVKVYKKVAVPNTFSPNNDGINDTWNIDALSVFPGVSVMVYDRYGRRVFESTGYSKAWNGTRNGSLLPEGTYYYIIDLKSNMPKLSGWVFIVR